jgi:hypothetical protein
MNAHTSPPKLSGYEEIIAGYRAIADTTERIAADMPSPTLDSAILFAASANSRRRRLRPMRYAAVAAGIACAGWVALISYHLIAPHVQDPLQQTPVARVDANVVTLARPNPDVTGHPASSGTVQFALPQMPQRSEVQSVATQASRGTPVSGTVTTRHGHQGHAPPRPETSAARVYQDSNDPKAPATMPASAPRIAQAPSNLRLWHGARESNSAPGLNDLVLNADPRAADARIGSVVATAAPETGVEVRHTEIDLNEPGALDRLARDNPDHCTKIRQILAEVDEIPERSVSRWMKAQFKATEIAYFPVLLTSNPPKRKLSFTLETTHYEALLTLTQDGVRLLPVRPSAP